MFMYALLTATQHKTPSAVCTCVSGCVCVCGDNIAHMMNAVRISIARKHRQNERTTYVYFHMRHMYECIVCRALNTRMDA